MRRSRSLSFRYGRSRSLTISAFRQVFVTDDRGLLRFLRFEKLRNFLSLTICISWAGSSSLLCDAEFNHYLRWDFFHNLPFSVAMAHVGDQVCFWWRFPKGSCYLCSFAAKSREIKKNMPRVFYFIWTNGAKRIVFVPETIQIIFKATMATQYLS